MAGKKKSRKWAALKREAARKKRLGKRNRLRVR